MRTLLVISSLNAGGAQRVLSILANAWVQRKHEVTLLTDADPRFDHFTLDPSIRRLALYGQSDSRHLREKLSRNILRVRRLRGVLRDVSPEVVLSFGDTMNTRVLISSLGLHIPVVVSERSDPRQNLIPWVWRVLRRLMYPSAKYLVVQTESVAHWARECVPVSRVRVIPNPVRPRTPLTARPRILSNRRTVIAVGRLSPEKGFDLLLSAFAYAALPATWQLVIVGEGPQRAELEAEVDALNLLDRVLMPGVVPDPTPWLQHSDMFVLPSKFEGFPNALLEAMHCGLPVLAFDCPSGPREIVRHEHTGILVLPRTTQALGTAIARLASESSLRKRLGTAAARDVAERFALERVSTMWEEVLSRASRQRG